MSDWQQFRNRLLSEDPGLREEYERLRPLYEVIADAISFRHVRGLSQEQLAQRMGKQQPAIARFEAGRVSPSLSFLRDLAEALSLKLTIRLESRDQLTEDEGVIPRAASSSAKPKV